MADILKGAIMKKQKIRKESEHSPKLFLHQLLKIILAGLVGFGAFILAVEILFQGVLYLSVYVGVTACSPLTVLILWGILSLLLLAVVVGLLFLTVGRAWREIFQLGKRKEEKV